MTAAGEWTPEGQAARERQGAFERARDSNERWRTGHRYIETPAERPTFHGPTVERVARALAIDAGNAWADLGASRQDWYRRQACAALGAMFDDDAWPTAGQCSNAYTLLQAHGMTFPPDVGPLTGMARVLRAARPYLTTPTEDQ